MVFDGTVVVGVRRTPTSLAEVCAKVGISIVVLISAVSVATPVKVAVRVSVRVSVSYIVVYVIVLSCRRLSLGKPLSAAGHANADDKNESRTKAEASLERVVCIVDQLDVAQGEKE